MASEGGDCLLTVLLLAVAAFLVLAGVVLAASLAVVIAVLAVAGPAAVAQAVALSVVLALRFVACLVGALAKMLLAAVSLFGVILVTALVWLVQCPAALPQMEIYISMKEDVFNLEECG